MRKYKLFLHILLLLVVLLGSSSGLFAAIAAGETVPEHITLTWSEDPKTTQTITWQTAATTVDGLVQYAEAMNKQLLPLHAVRIAADVTALHTNTGSVAVHSATLTGLKPNTRYVYQVGGISGWSQPQYFTTAPATDKAFSFLVFGDSQSMNYGTWEKTLHNAFRVNHQAAFFANVGDLVDVGQDYSHWDKWFRAGQGVIDTIPAMPITGNHEFYTVQHHQFSLPELFTAKLKLPLNGPEGLKGRVYSFDYGDAHFVMLDSQEGEQRGFVPDMLERQKVWLEKDLQQTRKKWKIGFIHRPLYNNKPGEGEINIRKAFAPIFDKYHMDVVFTGHDHTYARTYSLFAGMPTDSPAKGTIYAATGRSGTKTYPNVLSKERHAFFYDPQDEPNYLVVAVDQTTLAVKAFKQSGVLIDSWEIRK
ncbi:purple acid phosphatase family protein [Sporomusa acidovorans]|uniref:Fibronectin type-III domain-containing protein n=1 Tax=Sporomusa acidovorans (strain ATCC 49682 / DSM 3132 / Mol) TaxID=1123286 RepID=A0ABZ3J7T6_SPOA4|nr:metallophosphoesterase family protein [Sporomusa acidovorans]OZC16726.1 alkaline phosphatase precursor [Sporomusa acidovorans DSM 3132]SDE04610.1 Calcineurin-like phosphoesterase [Sporomusa acidovorans]